MGILRRLHIPTNTAYDFESDPAEQAEFTNPVVVSNKQVELANAALAVAGKLTFLNRAMARAKQQLEVAEAQLEDFELALLSRREPPAADRKSNRLLQMYLRRIAGESEPGLQQYQALIDAARAARQDIHRLQGEIDNQKHYFFTIKLVGEHAQTYLSFVKDEARRRGYGP